jgi:hypothetical protein
MESKNLFQVKLDFIINNVVLTSRCFGKKWFFWFFERWLVFRENQMCHLRVGCLFYTDAQRLSIGDGGAIEKRQPNICTNAQSNYKC